jgi:predicted TIM-barrel fold metal-dependent hydrolase
MLDARGFARGVLVQPSVYGFDNRCLLNALDRACGRVMGVAVPAPESTPADLYALHERCVRGVRCNVLNSGGLDPTVALGWEPVLRELGWHVAFQVDVETIPDVAWYFGRFTVPVVVDHMGRPQPGYTDPDRPGLRQLIELVRAGRCYVKLSAPYRLSVEPPPWRDVRPLARTLVAANPAACLWGTDWPHPQHAAVSIVDLLAALSDWCPEANTKHEMLCEAPRRLYG